MQPYSGDASFLRDLIERCRSLCGDFQKAAKETQNSAEKGLILESASQLRGFADELDAEAIRLGARPSHDSGVASVIELVESAVAQVLQPAGAVSSSGLAQKLHALAERYSAAVQLTHEPETKSMLAKQMRSLKESEERLEAVSDLGS